MRQPRWSLASLLDLLVENGPDFGNQFQNAPFLFWSEINERSLLCEVAESNAVIFHIGLSES